MAGSAQKSSQQPTPTNQQPKPAATTTATSLDTAAKNDTAAKKLPPEALQALVAPIALYPDPLLAQTLAASTYPLEIVQLHQYMLKYPKLKDQALADSIGYPVMVKAAAGGGGRGMRIVRARDMLAQAFATCQAEAAQAFGSSELYLEKFVEEARHVEVQVLGDRNGIRVHLGERDCSVQRRHQKLLEEGPACAISDETRAGLYKAALTVANAVNYVSAGTVEFLVASDGSFYFIEMNTRIQVEHPVTEMLTGIDIVREQVRIASGEPLGYKQKDVEFRGHAIECRINAEDPEHFIPSPGTVTAWHAPGGPGVRVDSHMMAGAVVTPFYDSLIAKIIVHANDRAAAIARMHRALSETVVEGVKTTIPYHLKLLADPAFVAGESTLARLEQNL